MDERTRAAIRVAQRNEITEHHIYAALAARSTGKNKIILRRIAKDERGHHDFWKALTQEEVSPRWWTVRWYVFLARVFGLVFALRLMERGEDLAQEAYHKLEHIEGVRRIINDEEHHEQLLLDMLREERLEYAGSMVLGLNDALVELTGALAGLTLAIQNASIVAIAGLVTGIAAALSMAASEYLSSEEEAGQKDSQKAALYTGVAYIITVALLIAPYFFFANIFVALSVTLCIAVLIIFTYTFYITVAKRQRFWPRFLKMAAISLGVAAISFGVGLVLRATIGVEV
ncbi:rubrerythrin family protein [Candidatus Woesearchaeota archaeon]|nr:MAG: rubrerythrin family protein [Candidatus Woesearchaeota archaeon]